MGKRQGRAKASLPSVLRRHLGQRTVLGVAVPVLCDHIDACKAGILPKGLTEKEIEAGFGKLTGKYLKSDWHSTYIDRRLGPRGFLVLSQDRYRFRDELLVEVTVEDAVNLHEELVESLRSAYERRQEVIERLEAASKLPETCIDERKALVGEYLRQLSGNRGEMFEVVSFAVLREYFRTFGFTLRRFSTTHANDGGMDFVAMDAIYQVAADESIQKIRKDLRKSPGTQRVLVRPTISQKSLDSCEQEVLEAIELQDLLNHFIAWLLGRDLKSKRASTLFRKSCDYRVRLSRRL